MTAQSITRKGHRPAVMRFWWDSQDRLTGLVNWRGEQWEYRYDALGRRTEKSCEQKGIRITWLWDGDTPAEEREYRHGELWRVRQSVYNGFELLAQHEQWREGEAGETWRRETRYAVSSPAGEPVALFSGNGECVWRKPERSLWGVKLWETGENPRDPGLLFAGQMVDSESGLAYNRFRYYSAETACYLTSDPIGLRGGINLYAYAPNPLSYIDPLGLKCATLEYHHRQKPGKITNLRELKRQIRGQIRAFNKILKEEGMEGLKRRISNYTANVEKQGRDYVRKLGSAEDGKVWLHEPDMRTGGLPGDVSRTGLSRENSILGGNAPQIADQILSMSNDVDKLTAKLILSGISP